MRQASIVLLLVLLFCYVSAEAVLDAPGFEDVDLLSTETVLRNKETYEENLLGDHTATVYSPEEMEMHNTLARIQREVHSTLSKGKENNLEETVQREVEEIVQENSLANKVQAEMEIMYSKNTVVYFDDETGVNSADDSQF